jgi:N utilization substance protein A
LAAKLTGWKIDIISETRAAEVELEELTGGNRDEEPEASADLFSAMTAKDAIDRIKSTESVKDLAGMEEGEKRVTVLRAFETRVVELTESADTEGSETVEDSEDTGE